MRVMISQPMKGLTREQIEEDRAKAVAILESQGHTVVDSIVADTPPKDSNEALFYLGKALEIMASCDAVLFLGGEWENARGCQIEHEACTKYGIKTLYGFWFGEFHISENLAFTPEKLAGILYKECLGINIEVVKTAISLLESKVDDNIAMKSL